MWQLCVVYALVRRVDTGADEIGRSHKSARADPQDVPQLSTVMFPASPLSRDAVHRFFALAMLLGAV